MTTGDQNQADRADDQQKQAVQDAARGHDQPADDGHDWSTYNGPVWSAAEAARRCGIPRSTLSRRLAAGDIPGAVKADTGWRIPALGLALAGLAGRTAADADQDADSGNQGHGDADAAASAQVAILTARLETERARREGAERLAEERAEHIRDLQASLRALTPPPAADDSTDGDQDADQPADTPTPQTTGLQPRRGLFARLRDALTAD